MKKIVLLISISFALFAISCSSAKLTPAQKLEKKQQKIAENVEKIELPDFSFFPDEVTPEFGVSHALMECVTCSLSVTKNRVEVNLPYLGHFYIQPTDWRNDIPIKFVTNKFIYTVNYNEKDDDFNIEIIPQDAGSIMNDGIVFRMTLKKDGRGTLSVKSNGRDEISYEGDFR
ncbi:MAG: DUF4251 domain-containing protein [Dysgonomonas sp.]